MLAGSNRVLDEIDADIGASQQRPYLVHAARGLALVDRNAAVVAIGFLPLLFSSLTPYVIVGLFLAAIIVLSWLSTVIALPALVAKVDNRR